MTADEDVVIARALKSRLRREITRMIKAAARSERFPDLEVSLRLCGDAVMRELSSDGSSKTGGTALLVRQQGVAEQDPVREIVISLPAANRQAKQGLHAELLRLASYGLCRLLGYDAGDEQTERALELRAAALRREAVRGGHIRAA